MAQHDGVLSDADSHAVRGRGQTASRLLTGRQGLLRRRRRSAISPRDFEEEYHQPPKPAEAGLGETITLTGTNLGIRLGVTVTGVERVKVGARRYTAVKLGLENTGIAIHDDELRAAAVTYGDEASEPLARGREGRLLERLRVGRAPRRRAQDQRLPAFRVSGSEPPDTFQLALEQVPITAGGIWNLKKRTSGDRARTQTRNAAGCSR